MSVVKPWDLLRRPQSVSLFRLIESILIFSVHLILLIRMKYDVRN
jgi:hypothetical protein